jgi:hypothetical protein
LLAPLIEDIFIEDRLELVGHRDQLLGSHPTCLSFIEGVGGVDGSFQKSPEFQEIRSSKPSLDSLSPYLCIAIGESKNIRY